ncbi:hypothetical protein MGSAQ_001561, partial [marine sediment metagenome]
ECLVLTLLNMSAIVTENLAQEKRKYFALSPKNFAA